LTNLVIDQATPKMTKSERVTEWQYFVPAILAAVDGILFWANWNNNAARWLMGIGGGVFLVWMLVTDLGQLRNSRAKRKPDDPTTAAP
jgi:hypothetical protein